LSEVLYVDTSAVLRAVLERGVTPTVERRIGGARFLLTARLALVESGRVFARLRHEGVPEKVLADAAREADSIWARCAVWELTSAVCDLAASVAPGQPLRALDALRLATYLLARRSFGDELELVTTDDHLEAALRSL
jgi:predicted nucleic acid-binding protein